MYSMPVTGKERKSNPLCIERPHFVSCAAEGKAVLIRHLIAEHAEIGSCSVVFAFRYVQKAKLQRNRYVLPSHGYAILKRG